MDLPHMTLVKRYVPQLIYQLIYQDSRDLGKYQTHSKTEAQP